MKTKKLLRKIRELLNAERRAQIAKYESLEEVLQKLQTKEVELRAKLEEAAGKGRRREILRKLEVVEAQRKKGEKLKKEIKDLRDT
ncbi:MAG: hypothetical protein JRG95_20430 [Deltaproteobacteria bacterium]|nr:hypothetical protein [Deltaproteobacteria bacterium]